MWLGKIGAISTGEGSLGSCCHTKGADRVLLGRFSIPDLGVHVKNDFDASRGLVSLSGGVVGIWKVSYPGVSDL